MPNKTISARLDESTLAKVEWLKRNSGFGDTTEVVVEAIHVLYTLTRKSEKQTAFDFLAESGFIGSIQGESNLSTDYKHHTADRFKKKHGFDMEAL